MVDRVRMTPPAVETLHINVYSSVSYHCICPLCDGNRLYIPSISSVYMFVLDVAVKVCLRMRLLHFLVFAPLFYFIFALTISSCAIAHIFLTIFYNLSLQELLQNCHS